MWGVAAGLRRAGGGEHQPPGTQYRPISMSVLRFAVPPDQALLTRRSRRSTAVSAHDPLDGGR